MPYERPQERPDDAPPPFKVTLVRVIAIQVVALAVLWFLQFRYAV